MAEHSDKEKNTDKNIKKNKPHARRNTSRKQDEAGSQEAIETPKAVVAEQAAPKAPVPNPAPQAPRQNPPQQNQQSNPRLPKQEPTNGKAQMNNVEMQQEETPEAPKEVL
jgi:hypothetical protein